MSAQGNCLFLGTPDEKNLVPMLKGMFSGRQTFVVLEPWKLLTQLEIYCERRQITAVVSTNTAILEALLRKLGSDSAPKLSNYAGSVFEHKGVEITFIAPLSQLYSVNYGKFIAQRFISKVACPDSWAEPTGFNWELLTPKNIEGYFNAFHSALAIATDIETFKRNLAIRCIGYTAIFLDDRGVLSTTSVVLPITDLWALAWMRKFNKIPVDKVFQKGKYDNSYLLRYNAPPSNWFWDTANMFHATYSELPKDLAFLNAFYLRKVVYWKDLAETNDLFEYYKYNALDTWATANVFIQQIISAPNYARRNYTLSFPVAYPNLLSSMTGLIRDPERHVSARKEVDGLIEKELTSLRKCLGSPQFNPGSPKQVLQLLKVLGCKDLDSSDEINLKKASVRHPLNDFLLKKILNIRGWRKLATTYLRLPSDADPKTGEGGAKEYKGTFLYAIIEDNADTARNTSSEHPFWCGANVQNIPRGEPGEPSYTKDTLRGPENFFLGESDLEQAESRDTAYISGEEKLIENVTGPWDFHSKNASAFFGVTYESIYDDSTGKTLNKKLRDTSKRTNHGANYNMGPDVMVDTMGLDKVWEARKLLNLPYRVPTAVTEHLLTVFHMQYPGLRGPIKIRNEDVRLNLRLPKCENKLFAPGTFYASVATEVSITKRLVSRAFHHTDFNLSHYRPDAYIAEGDWTRYCFGKPDQNKLDLNSLVAHPPQSLNARTLNEAYLRVFYEIALPNPKTFRLHAQVHDSILHSYLAGHEHLSERVRELMEIPVTVRDVHGITRTFTVPAALKNGKTGKDGVLKRAVYWSETE